MSGFRSAGFALAVVATSLMGDPVSHPGVWDREIDGGEV